MARLSCVCPPLAQRSPLPAYGPPGLVTRARQCRAIGGPLRNVQCCCYQTAAGGIALFFRSGGSYSYLFLVIVPIITWIIISPESRRLVDLAVYTYHTILWIRSFISHNRLSTHRYTGYQPIIERCIPAVSHRHRGHRHRRPSLRLWPLRRWAQRRLRALSQCLWRGLVRAGSGRQGPRTQ